VKEISYKKEDFIKSLSLNKGFSNLLSKKIIEELLETLSILIKNNDLILKNIGSFRIIEKKERMGRNPKTKENYIIKKQKSLSFITSNYLKKLINE
tara:strand:- start:389 stop:676 length:288 start_codon:yes stop_codon:yes gene_type:complete